MKKIILLLALFVSTLSFSQKTNYDIPRKDAFQPMFSLGSGYYNSLGDIKGPDGNYLLGNMGINTGIRINLSENIDLSFLFTSNAKLHEESSTESFESDLNSIGFNLDYTFNSILQNTKITPFATTGAQWMYYKTTINNNTLAQESGINIPLGIGISLDVSERIRFDVGMNYHLSFADIDHATNLASNDNFTVVNFTIHYDLFTPKPDEYNYYDEKNYTKVNFKAIDVEDHDKDGVPDIDDHCPGTPKKVKVNEYGCPYDGDNDGVPDYLDDEKNTRPGAVVNERGVQLTDEEFHSMYSEYEVASIEYAKFYNESEIKRDDYKTTNEYLIAKANAFNKKYNNQEKTIYKGKKYVVQIGRFKDDIPEYLINRFLSFEDLISIPLEDGYFIYAVGDFDEIDDAERYMIEDLKIDIGAKAYKDLQTKIIVIENGIASDYIYLYEEEENNVDNDNLDPIEKTNIIHADSTSINNDSTSINNTTDTTSSKPISTVIYRVQVGAYERPLSYNIFKGLDVVPIVTGNMTRYYVGAFTNLERALIKRDEMKARGHKGSFIVKFENGIRSAKVTEQRNKRKKKKEVIIETPKIIFYVQIGVFSDENTNIKSKLNSIGGASKIPLKEGIYKYIAGSFNSLSEAEFRLSEVANNGFTDAFIYAEKDGKRIKVKDAVRLLNK